MHALTMMLALPNMSRPTLATRVTLGFVTPEATEFTAEFIGVTCAGGFFCMNRRLAALALPAAGWISGSALAACADALEYIHDAAIDEVEDEAPLIFVHGQAGELF